MLFRSVPATSATVQHGLGLRCGAVDVNAACSGFVYGLAMANGLIAIGANRVLLIGTDCPALTPQHLIDASNALDCHDAVITPAEDGGYVLLGLKRCPPEIFAGVNWGSEHVLAQTRDRLAALRWSWHEQPALWDVDRPADFERLAASELMPGIAAIRAHG